MNISEFYDEIKKILPSYPCTLGEMLVFQSPEVIPMCWRCSGIIIEAKCSFCRTNSAYSNKVTSERIKTNHQYVEYINSRINSCLYGLKVKKENKKFSCNYEIMMLSMISKHLTKEELHKYGHNVFEIEIKSCIKKYPELKDRAIQILENSYNDNIRDREDEIQFHLHLMEQVNKNIYVLHIDLEKIIEKNMEFQLNCAKQLALKTVH